MPKYTVLKFTLNHEPQDLTTYRHDAPFIDGDTRTIRYEEDWVVDQEFHGPTAIGGWYDID